MHQQPTGLATEELRADEVDECDSRMLGDVMRSMQKDAVGISNRGQSARRKKSPVVERESAGYRDCHVDLRKL